MVNNLEHGEGHLPNDQASQNLLLHSLGLCLHGAAILAGELAHLAGSPFQALFEEEVAVSSQYTFGWMSADEIELAQQEGMLDRDSSGNVPQTMTAEETDAALGSPAEESS